MKTLLRLVITALIFWLIFQGIDGQAVLNRLQQIDPLWLLGALLLQLASTLIASYRWFYVMENLGFKQKPRFFVASYFKGMFFNQGLPTSIGGDALRVLDVAQAEAGIRKRDAFAGVFIDRLLGLVSLLAITGIANLLWPDVFPDGIFWLITLMVLGGLLGFILFAFIHRLAWFDTFRPWRMLQEVSRRLNQAFHAHQVIIVVQSLVVHLLAVSAFYFLGLAVGLDQPWWLYAMIVPPALLLTVIPISLAGWGVREGAMIGLFGFVTSDSDAVLSVSILYGLTLIVVSLPGLMVYLRGRKKQQGGEA